MFSEREVLSGEGEIGEEVMMVLVPLAFIVQLPRAAQSPGAPGFISSSLTFPWHIGLAKW